MFLIERSVLPPRSRPQALEGQALAGTAARTPPVPATFLEPAAGGAFELFPRRQFAGSGNLVQASLPNPLMATLLARPGASDQAIPTDAPASQVAPPASRLRRSA